MTHEIKTINLKFLAGLASVNCYLIKTGTGFVLIDTGPSNKRNDLLEELEKADCRSENLKLIVITHGDTDHSGNANYLREEYGTKIAMHLDDSGMVEQGNMSFNRNTNIIARILFLLPFFRLNRSDRFKPDIYVKGGEDLLDYGLNGQIIHIPGHSKGSIGILLDDGDFFCGDLFTNTDKPVVNSIIDDEEAANASVEKLENLNIKTVYPGHGRPFLVEVFYKLKK